MSRASLSLLQVLVVQVIVAFTAVVIGALTGWLLGRHALEVEQYARLGMSADDLLARVHEVERDYQELYAHCEPLEGSERDRLIEAQERVESLRGEISDKEEEIAKLEKAAVENVSLRREVKRRKAELRELKSSLQAAEQQREELVEKLKVAVQEVAVARAEMRHAKAETLGVRWEEFRAQAALEICERGSRGKIEKCRDTVFAAFTPTRERRYRECVRKGGAVPQLRQAKKDEKELQAFAEWVDDSTRLTKGWYILFCDPSLPEAGDADAEAIREAVGESDPLEATGRKDAFLGALEDDQD